MPVYEYICKDCSKITEIKETLVALRWTSTMAI